MAIDMGAWTVVDETSLGHWHKHTVLTGSAPAAARYSFPLTPTCIMTSLYKQAYSAFVNEKPRVSLLSVR